MLPPLAPAVENGHSVWHHIRGNVGAGHPASDADRYIADRPTTRTLPPPPVVVAVTAGVVAGAPRLRRPPRRWARPGGIGAGEEM